MNDQLFEAYMTEIDRLLLGRIGVASGDLPDYNYRDAFNDEVVPREVVAELLERGIL